MRNSGKRLISLLLAAVLAFALAMPALAAVPDRPQNQYVLDSAGVLSDKTEQEIVSENKKLFKDTGAEIVVAAVDFLGGEDIDDYAYEMFNTWGVGSKERNNGILLVLAIGEDNYYVEPGYGVGDYFTGSKLQDMLDSYLEPDFAVGDYDAGVKKFFSAMLDEMESYYRGHTDEYTQGSFSQGGSNYNYNSYNDFDSDSSFSFFGSALWVIVSFIIRIVIVIIIVVVIIAFIRALSGGGRGGPRSGGGGGGFWTGMFLGNMMNSRRNRWRAPPSPPGGFGGPRPPRNGGFGGFGGSGFSGGGRSHGGGIGRSGGFHSGGGSRGGGAGRR